MEIQLRGHRGSGTRSGRRIRRDKPEEARRYRAAEFAAWLARASPLRGLSIVPTALIMQSANAQFRSIDIPACDSLDGRAPRAPSRILAICGRAKPDLDALR